MVVHLSIIHCSGKLSVLQNLFLYQMSDGKFPFFSWLQKKLIMVGSCQTLSKVPLLKLLIEKVDEQSGIFSVSKKDINIRELKRCSQMR